MASKRKAQFTYECPDLNSPEVQGAQAEVKAADARLDELVVLYGPGTLEYALLHEPRSGWGWPGAESELCYAWGRQQRAGHALLVAEGRLDSPMKRGPHKSAVARARLGRKPVHDSARSVRITVLAARV